MLIEDNKGSEWEVVGFEKETGGIVCRSGLCAKFDDGTCDDHHPRRLPILVGPSMLSILSSWCRYTPTLVLILLSMEYALAGSAVSNPITSVSVLTEHLEYQAGEPIQLKVSNLLNTPITTTDQKAFCSIVGLEQEIHEHWRKVSNCFAGPPPRAVTLAQHSRTIVEWPGLEIGRYRAVLEFAVGERFSFHDLQVTFSPVFVVRE